MAKNDLTETQLDSRVIFDGTLLHVRKDRVRLPNGVESYREYLVHPGAVVVIPFLDENTL
ncbi:MAG TPA: NUDIX hydrolase, partial [Candidatus Marinimicrobia bacterium]|nr:NUDIX hydrolase [Candidatus Neomarinimicrobiota bacterium]